MQERWLLRNWRRQRDLFFLALSPDSDFQFAEELKQRLCGRIVGHAEVRIDLAVSGLFGAEDRHGNAGVFQRVTQTLRLRARVGMLGDMQDQERRNILVLGRMRNRGEVSMLLRIVSELLPVTKLCLRQTMHPTSGLL